MINRTLCYALLLLFGMSCKNDSPRAELTLPKGKYEIWDDKPFGYRPCGQDATGADSLIYLKKEFPKDTTIEIQSFIIDGENTFVHNATFMWVRTQLPFSAEEVKYLRFLFPIDRKGKDCKPIYGYFLNRKRHKIYANNCIIDLNEKKCTKIDMSIYETCFLNGEYILCKIKNSGKEEKWNEKGEKL